MFVSALPAPARDLLTRLGREPLVKPFYLAGGSAVALHLVWGAPHLKEVLCRGGPEAGPALRGRRILLPRAPITARMRRPPSGRPRGT